MAQPIQQLTIQAPAFFGLNTTDSPVGIDPNFASVATNCVIDKQGRIGARKGLINLDGSSANKTVETVFESVLENGTIEIFSTGTEGSTNKIFKGTNLVEQTLPSNYNGGSGIIANDWKIVNFRNDTYFFQAGHNPLVYTSNTLVDLTVGDGGSLAGDTIAPQANEVLSAFGRLWAADIANNKTTVFFSDTLIGKGANAWTPQDGLGPDGQAGTADDIPANLAGSLNISENLPSGPDEIVALHAHNGFLIIFCKKSILIYANPESPTSLTLADSIAGVGCIARDSVQNIGTDVLFLSDTGVRSLGRVIQEKSLPMRDVSKNIRSDLLTLVQRETNKANIKSGHNAEEAFYLLTFPSSNTVVCFDVRSTLQDGAFRVTTWSDMNPLCFATRRDNSLVIGKLGGIYKYTGFFDKEIENGNYVDKDYQLSYFSNPMNFGNSSNLKFLKKFRITILGNRDADTVLNWGYDYTTAFNKQVINNTETNFASRAGEFTVSEFGISSADGLVGVTPDFSLELIDPSNQSPTGNTQPTTVLSAEYAGGIDLQNPTVNGSGSGTVLTIGLESKISGQSYSLQQIDVNVLLGRTI